MTTICKYCNEAENKQDKPGLVCDSCFGFIHLTCLKRPGTPGDFYCDVFFEFTCEDCSPDKKEKFRRNKFPWVQVILLTLHHLGLKAYGISNHGYFHYKTHICSFIDRYWQTLFGTQLKQKKNWIGTIAGALSVYNNLFFKSGSNSLGESGWWKLKHFFSPAVAMHILQEMARDKPKGRQRYQLAMERSLFYSKVFEMGYRDLLNTEPDAVPGIEPVPSKKRRVDNEDTSRVTSASFLEQIDMYQSCEGIEENPFEAALSTSSLRGYSDNDPLLAGVELVQSTQTLPSDSSSIHSYQQSTAFYDSDTATNSPYQTYPPSDSDEKQPPKKTEAKRKPTPEDKPPIRRETLFSNQLNSVDLPWLPTAKEKPGDLVEITQYEEIQLLKQVENLIPKVKDPNKRAYLCGFRASLALRRLKRHKHLPLFDLDKTVKLLGGYVTEEAKTTISSERVLDRFQRSYLIDNLCGTIASTNYGTMLLSDIEPVPFRSAYSGAVLKPYIRRDAESRPLWVKLMEEMLKKTHSKVSGYLPPAPRCIEYAYVRPGHVAALNCLCAQHFWPGIDLSETLQYPELSCVVTYGRVVIACAFLAPGAPGPAAGQAPGARLDAYLSFVLVRPHWRRAGIATTMLYHLLQTCTGQDVTLHCSPTNPAIFLYQKFGFKVEELIQDFYEKYYDIDYKGCRHALFLRLIR